MCINTCTYVFCHMLWYGGPVTWKTWLYSGNALNYIITLLNVHELKF
jgi:ABC-type multidrug transport system permease subunit